VPRRASLSLVAIAVGIAAPAYADVAVVAVSARQPAENDAAVTGAMRDALGDVREDPEGDARDALDAGAVPVAALAAFADVRQRVADGWSAYLQVQTDDAMAKLGAARTEAEALLPLDGGIEAYADIALRLGAVLDNQGKHDEADEQLRLAAALDPGRVLLPSEFSPDVIAAYTRAQQATPSRVLLAVACDAPGARIAIDGVAIGASPAEVDLALGPHVVVVGAPDHTARGQTVEVPAAGAEIEVTLDADPTSAALGARPARGADPSAWLDAVATYADLDGIVLVSAVERSGRPALLAQWCDGARCTKVIEVGYDEGDLPAAAREAADELAEAKKGRLGAPTLTTDARLDASAVIVGGKHHHCRWCKPALYVGAGVLVAAATAVVIGIAAGGDDGTTIGLMPCDFATCTPP
jgi:hypothetical protein